MEFPDAIFFAQSERTLKKDVAAMQYDTCLLGPLYLVAVNTAPFEYRCIPPFTAALQRVYLRRWATYFAYVDALSKKAP